MNKYLFCYFTGNAPEEERIRFAVSEDGYDFKALNGNRAVINQTLGKKCCRDPFVFRDNEDRFHIIATDMRSEDGWANNNSMVVWDSDDLIEWKNERIIDWLGRRKYCSREKGGFGGPIFRENFGVC